MDTSFSNGVYRLGFDLQQNIQHTHSIHAHMTEEASRKRAREHEPQGDRSVRPRLDSFQQNNGHIFFSAQSQGEGGADTPTSLPNAQKG